MNEQGRIARIIHARREAKDSRPHLMPMLYGWYCFCRWGWAKGATRDEAYYNWKQGRRDYFKGDAT